MLKPRFPESIVAWKLVNCNRLGLPPPADGLPLATNSESSNLAAAAAALVAFRIGYFAATNGNQLQRRQVLVYNETAKLEFEYLQLLVANLQCHNGGIATVIFDRIQLSKNERWNQL